MFGIKQKCFNYKDIVPLIILILVIVALFITNHHKSHEKITPSISIENIPKLNYTYDENGQWCPIVDEIEYEFYMDLSPSDYDQIIMHDVPTSAIVAHFWNDWFILKYYAFSYDLTKDWLICYYEDGSGTINKNNVSCIYKAKSVDSIPVQIIRLQD